MSGRAVRRATIPVGVMRGLAWCACFVVCVGARIAAADVDIQEAQWGFDGRVREGAFNLLFLHVRNDQAEPLEGSLRLVGYDGVRRDGLPVEAPLYVGPFSSRWVTLEAFVTSADTRWEAVLNRRMVFPLPGARASKLPARILLTDRQSVRPTTAAVRPFEQSLFPASVTSLGSLQAVVLDEMPRWTAPQRQALLDWLDLGGHLFVLTNEAGTLPELTEELGVLNGSQDFERYGGGGTIYRPGLSVAALGRGEGQRLFAELPGGIDEDSKSFGSWSANFDVLSVFPLMKGLLVRNHNWFLINLLSLAYLGLIFPGMYVFGQHLKDWRLVYLALGLTVLVASAVFTHLGRRGYGEATTIFSVALARHAPEAIDVQQWSYVFVTNGGDYTLRHQGTGLSYAASVNQETVAGNIANWTPVGSAPAIQIDIPPFSSRQILSHMRLKTGQLTGRVTQVAWGPARTEPLVDPALENLSQWNLPVTKTDADATISTAPLLSLEVQLSGAEVEQLARQQQRPTVWLLTDNDMSLMKWDGTKLRLDHGAGRIFDSLQLTQSNVWMPTFGNPPRAKETIYQDLWHRLLTVSLGVHSMEEAARFRLPPHEGRLFFFMPMTKEYFADGAEYPAQEGRVLHVVHLDLSRRQAMDAAATPPSDPSLPLTEAPAAPAEEPGPAPADALPPDTTPADSAPPETTPSETTPADTTPPDAAPTVPAPTDTAPGAEPSTRFHGRPPGTDTLLSRADAAHDRLQETP